VADTFLVEAGLPDTPAVEAREEEVPGSIRQAHTVPGLAHHMEVGVSRTEAGILGYQDLAGADLLAVEFHRGAYHMVVDSFAGGRELDNYCDGDVGSDVRMGSWVR
jgi:hypothetical protein